MDLLSMGLRTVLVYFLVFVALKITGKREIGKLSIFDLVISIMIAEIAVVIVDDISRPLIEGILPMAILVLIQLLIAYVSLKSRRIRLWVDGKPSILIRNGKLDREQMKKQKYNLDDLMTQLRERNVISVADVEFAFLETTGKLNVVKKDQFKEEEQTSDPSGTRGSIRYEGLPIPLIMDGKVQEQSLHEIGQNRFWLKSELQARGVQDFKEVFLCTYDHKGRFYIDKI